MAIGTGITQSLPVRLAAAGLIGTLAVTAIPAEARNDKREWRDDRRDNRQNSRNIRAHQRNAYQQGYRDGRQQQVRVQRPARVQAPVYRAQPGYVYQGNRYPVQRSYPVQTAYRGDSRGWVNGQDYWYSNGRYQCRRSDGTTGLVVGAVAGGTLGNILAGQGDKTLGSIIGGTLGAIIGKEIEKGEARCR